MKCTHCNENAVYPGYCKKHFINYFEDKVKKTIKDYKLIKSNDKIIVAVSGGKDSTTILYILNKLYDNVEALCIDEGIKGYRDKTIKDIKLFCKKNKIKLKIISFQNEINYSLDNLKNKIELQPCSICGTFRRYLLNKYSKDYDVLVTGHNLDDEAQAVLMNIFRNNIELSSRLGPKTGLVKSELFTQRIKPLYFCLEKEVMTYSYLKGFDITFTECPNVVYSFRGAVRDFLNEYESIHPGTKKNVINIFLKILPDIKHNFDINIGPEKCKKCGQASKKEICKACQLINQLNASS